MQENASIEIFDNGSGMDYNDLSEKYVLIGKVSEKMTR